MDGITSTTILIKCVMLIVHWGNTCLILRMAFVQTVQAVAHPALIQVTAMNAGLDFSFLNIKTMTDKH